LHIIFNEFHKLTILREKYFLTLSRHGFLKVLISGMVLYTPWARYTFFNNKRKPHRIKLYVTSTKWHLFRLFAFL